MWRWCGLFRRSWWKRWIIVKEKLQSRWANEDMGGGQKRKLSKFFHKDLVPLHQFIDIALDKVDNLYVYPLHECFSNLDDAMMPFFNSFGLDVDHCPRMLILPYSQTSNPRHSVFKMAADLAELLLFWGPTTQQVSVY